MATPLWLARRMDSRRYRQCTRKVRYRSQDRALGAIAEICERHPERDGEMQAYDCEFCEGWHGGRRPEVVRRDKLRREEARRRGDLSSMERSWRKQVLAAYKSGDMVQVDALRSSKPGGEHLVGSDQLVPVREQE